MADRVVTGVDELDAVLYELERAVANRVARAVLGKALTVIARNIRNAVPPTKTPGHTNRGIKKSIGRTNKRGRSGEHVAKTGVAVGRRRAGSAPHAHLLALGTAPRKNRRGQNRGSVAPYRFVREGFANSTAEAQQAMVDAFRKAVEREIAKAARKHGSRNPGGRRRVFAGGVGDDRSRGGLTAAAGGRR